MLVQHVDWQRIRPPILVLSPKQRTHFDFTARAHGATIAWI
jgi:hypothetical protein